MNHPTANVPPGYDNDRIVINLPSQSARLGFESTAKLLATSVESSRPPFAVGIFRPWGSDKTTLMQGVQRSLASKYSVPVQFSACRYEKEDYLRIPLLDTIREALISWMGARGFAGNDVRDAVFKTAATIDRVVTSILAGVTLKAGLPGALEFAFEANDALAKARELGEEADHNRHRSNLSSQVARRGEPTFPQSVYHAVFRQLSETFAGSGPRLRRRTRLRRCASSCSSTISIAVCLTAMSWCGSARSA